MLGTITLGALERAELVTPWGWRSAGQPRAGLAVRTARALYDAQRRTGRIRAKAEHAGTLSGSGGRPPHCRAPATDRVIFSPWKLVRWSILTTTHQFSYLDIAGPRKNGKPTPIAASINQATLAEMIGTTRPRVSFFLNKFRKLGLISYNGKIEVHRSLLNAVLYEKPQLERDEEPTE
ncbi:helix-turn-helix domain-containing protein [Bradyrhizobium elkanii]|uniref:helix-turn-helix domain-containing protein n=1 Tax=Bradyrhizobium elkanii TaxID=29448 RepID=UPI001FCB4CF5|nr:helix-turn-helix domain-containing protein [Bradyrhizobium elkanii]WLA86335.1 helix-turn-helix domain-containing protein [Bradyrhizobium elkanii]